MQLIPVINFDPLTSGFSVCYISWRHAVFDAMSPVRCPRHRFAWGGTANMGAQRAGAPVLTGSVPPLAPFYHARQETGFGLADALRPGETILLVPAMLGTGGTGKTQLAVGFAHAMWSARAVDLLVWVPAGTGARSSPATRGRRPTWTCSPARRRPAPRRTAPRSASSAGCARPSAAGRWCSTAWPPPSTSTGCGRRARPGRSS